MIDRMKQIVDLLLGYKYYAVVVHRTGTDIYELSSFLFKSKKEVELFKLDILNTRSFEYVETVSFRSWTDYQKIR